jgi:hypothetical protein
MKFRTFMKFRTLLISASVFAAAIAFSPIAHAQSMSEWGNAIVGTGQDLWHGTEHVFHQVADDPVLIERTKSALDDDPVTRNQPIIVSANNGVIALQGRVDRHVADTAVRIARDVPGARGVNNEMLYEGAPMARNYTAPHQNYGPNYGAENPNYPNYGPNAPNYNANSGAYGTNNGAAYPPNYGPKNAPYGPNYGPND